MSDPDLAVVVFAYNEGDNVQPVLEELRRWLTRNEPEAEIVFVDDGSSDPTSDAARRALTGARAIFRRHPSNRGIGAALKTGTEATNARWVTFMPADGQIEPEAIGTLRKAAAHDRADVVLSVYDHRDDGAHRKLLSFGVRALIFAFHGVRLRSDGPYLFRRSLFDPKQLAPDSFFLNSEFPIRALRAGLRVTTVTINCRKRLAGHSKSTGYRRVLGVARDLVDLRGRRISELVDRTIGRHRS